MLCTCTHTRDISYDSVRSTRARNQCYAAAEHENLCGWRKLRANGGCVWWTLEGKNRSNAPRSSLLLSNLQTTSFSFLFQATTINTFAIFNNSLSIAAPHAIGYHLHFIVIASFAARTIRKLSLVAFRHPSSLPTLHHHFFSTLLSEIACRSTTFPHHLNNTRHRQTPYARSSSLRLAHIPPPRRLFWSPSKLALRRSATSASSLDLIRFERRRRCPRTNS